MKANFERALADLLSPDREGGFVNHPDDPGGMTNLGVTKAVWEAWVRHPVDEKAMRALTVADVAPLYKRKYWDAAKCDELPEGVDYIVFDTAVNSGPGRAIKFLQGCVGVDMDGALGPKTLAAVRAASAKQIIEDYAKRRLSFLRDLPNWDTFSRGWVRRVAEVQNTASTMTA
jgi:lysozyme family protein